MTDEDWTQTCKMSLLAGHGWPRISVGRCLERAGRNWWTWYRRLDWLGFLWRWEEDTPAPVETKEAPIQRWQLESKKMARRTMARSSSARYGKRTKKRSIWSTPSMKTTCTLTEQNTVRQTGPGHPRYRHYGNDVRFYGFSNNEWLLRQKSIAVHFRLGAIRVRANRNLDPTLATSWQYAGAMSSKSGTVMGWQGNGYFDPPIAGEGKIMSAPKRLNSSYHQPWIVDQRGKKGKKDTKTISVHTNDLINDETTMHDAPVRKVRDKPARLPYERKKHKRRLIFRASKAKKQLPKRDKAAQGHSVAIPPNEVRKKLNKRNGRRLIQRRTTYPLRTQQDAVAADDFGALTATKIWTIGSPKNSQKKCG